MNDKANDEQRAKETKFKGKATNKPVSGICLPFNELIVFLAAQNLGQRGSVIHLMAIMLDKFRLKNIFIPFIDDISSEDGSRWGGLKKSAENTLKLGKEKNIFLKNLVKREVIQIEREAAIQECSIPYLYNLLRATLEENAQITNVEIPRLQSIPIIDMILDKLSDSFLKLKSKLFNLERLKQLSTELKKLNPNTVKRNFDCLEEKEEPDGTTFQTFNRNQKEDEANILANNNNTKINFENGINYNEIDSPFAKINNAKRLLSEATNFNASSVTDFSRPTSSSKILGKSYKNKMLKLEDFIRLKIEEYNKKTEKLLKDVDHLENYPVQKFIKVNGVDLRFLSLSSDEEESEVKSIQRNEKAEQVALSSNLSGNFELSNKNKIFVVSAPAVQDPNQELEKIYRTFSKNVKTKTLANSSNYSFLYEETSLIHKQGKTNLEAPKIKKPVLVNRLGEDSIALNKKEGQGTCSQPTGNKAVKEEKKETHLSDEMKTTTLKGSSLFTPTTLDSQDKISQFSNNFLLKGTFSSHIADSKQGSAEILNLRQTDLVNNPAKFSNSSATFFSNLTSSSSNIAENSANLKIQPKILLPLKKEEIKEFLAENKTAPEKTPFCLFSPLNVSVNSHFDGYCLPPANSLFYKPDPNKNLPAQLKNSGTEPQLINSPIINGLFNSNFHPSLPVGLQRKLSTTLPDKTYEGVNPQIINEQDSVFTNKLLDETMVEKPLVAIINKHPGTVFASPSDWLNLEKAKFSSNEKFPKSNQQTHQNFYLQQASPMSLIRQTELRNPLNNIFPSFNTTIQSQFFIPNGSASFTNIK